MTGSIDPTRPQFDAFKALPRDEPIHMLNLIRLKALADYPPDHPNHGKGMTGLEAYRAYGRDSAEVFKRVGGRQVWAGRPDVVLTGPTTSAGTSPSSRSTPAAGRSWPWSPTPATANTSDTARPRWRIAV